MIFYLLLSFFVLLSFSDAFVETLKEYNGFSKEIQRNFQRSDNRPPGERGVGPPSTVNEMQKRFAEDIEAILRDASRPHYDDLALFYHEKVKLRTCFEPTRHLDEDTFRRFIFFLSVFFDHYVEIRTYVMSRTYDDDFVIGEAFINSTAIHGQNHLGKITYVASKDYDKGTFFINDFMFVGDCRKFPTENPPDPLQNIDDFVEKIRSRTRHGIFLPDRAPNKLADFEELGDLISGDAHISVCDEPQMNKKQFIQYMTTRYQNVRHYENHELTQGENNQDYEVNLGVTWKYATNITRDFFQFRIRKTSIFYPQSDLSLFQWRIYWVVQKCPVDMDNSIPLVSNSHFLSQVTKRFSDVIDGQNWDVMQAFLDLFEPSELIWGTCSGSRKQKFEAIRPYMDSLAMRYAKAVVSAILIRHLESMDFTAIYLASRANGIQEQEEIKVSFYGYKNSTTKMWRLSKMYFECGEGDY